MGINKNSEVIKSLFKIRFIKGEGVIEKKDLSEHFYN